MHIELSLPMVGGVYGDRKRVHRMWTEEYADSLRGVYIQFTVILR